MKLFVDTWGWIVLADRKEPRHKQVFHLVEERGTVPGRIVTSDYVLDETLTLVFRRRPFAEGWRFAQGIMSNAARRSLVIETVSPERFRTALELRRRYADKPKISFTDLTTIAIMQDLAVQDILTADADFRRVGLDFRTLPD